MRLYFLAMFKAIPTKSHQHDYLTINLTRITIGRVDRRNPQFYTNRYKQISNA